ncbi:response regulator transcription factor [Shewanella halifaxensis]|nr:response regulator [Shewanella halifaxensis]
MTNTNLYLVDDDESVLDALDFALQGEGYQPLSFNSAEAFWLWAKQHADKMNEGGCLILDSRMPGMSGQELQYQLSQTDCSLGIVFLTGHGDVPMAVDALKLGAVDFLQKPIEITKLLKAVSQAFDASTSSKELKSAIRCYEELTLRERDILQLLAQGKTNQQLAELLFISARTVEVHRSNMLKHLQMDSLAKMVRLYTLVEPYLSSIAPPPLRIRRKTKHND